MKTGATNVGADVLQRSNSLGFDAGASSTRDYEKLKERIKLVQEARQNVLAFFEAKARGDRKAAEAHNVMVCNVPDYGVVCGVPD